jgi:hypothetical protein
VSVTSDDRIVVTDAVADAVVLYDLAACTGRTIARKGHGPGEVSRVYRAWVTPGDSIVTWDSGNRWIQVFDPDGTFRRSVGLDANRLGAGTAPIGRLPDGEFLGLRPNEVAPDRPAERDSATHLRLSGDSLRLLDTGALLPEYSRYSIRVTAGGQTGVQRQNMIFPHTTHVFTPPTGFFVADNASWQLREYNARGALRRSIAPRPVPPDDLALHRQRFEKGIPRHPLDPTRPAGPVHRPDPRGAPSRHHAHVRWSGSLARRDVLGGALRPARDGAAAVIGHRSVGPVPGRGRPSARLLAHGGDGDLRAGAGGGRLRGSGVRRHPLLKQGS